MADDRKLCLECPDKSMIGQAISRCSGCGQQRWYGIGDCTACGTRGPASCVACNDTGFAPVSPQGETEP